MAQVRDYYPGDFWNDIKQTLAWIYGRQNAPIGNWLGNAVGTPTTNAFAECGIVSVSDFSTFAQTVVENIVIDPPVGVLPDQALGPDSFPINFSPIGLPQGNILLNVFQNSASQRVGGRCFNLIQVLANYRVDVFAKTDVFYYQGSSSLTNLGSGVASWSVAGVLAGSIIAVLYPTTVAQPGVGSFFSVIPAGWVAHSNMGVGKKLTSYFATVFSKTDIEYQQETNIPIIVQDAHHARSGSSVIPAAGTMTVHILFNDPVAGAKNVFSSLQTLATFKDLPRSFTVPTSDPLYIPDVTATNSAALQNRSFIYDCALFILNACAAGNFSAASKVIKQLNFFLDNPGFLASLVLENAEDGLITRWTPVNGSVANVAASSTIPQEPPYGNGNLIKFTSTLSGATFTFAGAGFPDTGDKMLSFEHLDATPSTATYLVDVGVTSSTGAVVGVRVTISIVSPLPAPSYDPVAKIITVPIAYDGGNWRTTLLNLSSLIPSLVSGETLVSITSFKVTLNYVGNFWLDNLMVGNLQPQDSLSFSYDIYNGIIDQAYIRAGAMAWVVYAYCLYMGTSLDYSSALYLQRMINFIETLKSSAADLTNGLYYLGWGTYQDPGYQFIPGLRLTVSMEHQVDLYFAWKRAAKILPTAATQLLKAGTITSAQATSLNTTATTVNAEADTIWTKVSTNLYIAPGADPGHFAQGVTGNVLDTSQALDASGTWSSLLAHAAGDDTKATECLKFVHQKFYLTGKQILLSTLASSFNQAYQQLTLFSGFKTYNDSAGGYTGSPLSVWQEGTWGMILALLDLYSVTTVQTYFNGVFGGAGTAGLDTFLTTLISDQRLIRSTTGDGSVLAWSLAARLLPWEFEVWPMLSPAVWWWLTAIAPSFLLSTDTVPATLPYLYIPRGVGQHVTEREGVSSLSSLEVEMIDPGSVIKGLASQQQLVGKVATLKVGFPNLALGDFVKLHTVQIVSAGWTTGGRMKIDCVDVQRFMIEQLWSNGGPGSWQPGQAAPPQPLFATVGKNGFPCSDKNPRYVQGNPLDIFLAAMQNELGVGQDPALPQSAWAIYQPGNDATLINPNPFMDVPGILSLRNGPFSGDWLEFKITRPVMGKQWLTDEILKVLGLYMIVGPEGKLRLKSMKSPQVLQPVMAFNERNLLELPAFSRLPVVNVVTVRMGYDTSQRETAAPQFGDEVTFIQQTSSLQERQQFKQNIEARGLRMNYGGMLRAFLIADRIFRRYAFATPKYRCKVNFTSVPVELGDFVWLNHALLPDLFNGRTGLTNVVCEVVDRQPAYSEGYMEFELLDTRFMNLTTPFQVAPLSAGVPAYASASAAQRKQYMFVSSTAGLNSDGTPGNTIF